MTGTVYARVPIEAIGDARLSPTEFKVLIALLAFANRDTGAAWAKRETLSSMCGVHPANISRATAALVEYGWITKDGNGGRGRPARYLVNAPRLFTRAESAQVKRETRADSSTKTRADSITKTRADSARGIEQSSDQIIEQNAGHLHEMRRQLDRLPYQPDQANPILVSIADDLGFVIGAGQSSHDLAQRLRREIESRITGNAPSNVVRLSGRGG